MSDTETPENTEVKERRSRPSRRKNESDPDRRKIMRRQLQRRRQPSNQEYSRVTEGFENKRSGTDRRNWNERRMDGDRRFAEIRRRVQNP